MEFNLAQTIAIYALPVIFAITLHEAAHGYVARHFGDRTAFMLGRISLNPVRHIDWVGTIAVPLVILVASKLFGGPAVLFGWAKPVPVNFQALRHPKKDMLWVAAAGPAANLAMALGWALLAKVALLLPLGPYSLPLGLMSEAGITVNMVLMVLNLLPILPLDGGRIAVSLLPDRLALRYARLEPFGFPILLVLIFLPPHVLGSLMMPMVQASIGMIETLFRL
ncbi:MAG TPA: site-2 protease family protein [Burkholderiales bacterium]|nr:site-2 protease family protein [Burkholderiales bacterium]